MAIKSYEFDIAEVKIQFEVEEELVKSQASLYPLTPEFGVYGIAETINDTDASSVQVIEVVISLGRDERQSSVEITTLLPVSLIVGLTYLLLGALKHPEESWEFRYLRKYGLYLNYSPPGILEVVSVQQTVEMLLPPPKDTSPN